MDSGEFSALTTDKTHLGGSAVNRTPKARARAIERGHSLPDGSFPISDGADLRRAVNAYGRAKDKEAAKKHIIKRAKELGKERFLPESWGVPVPKPEAAVVESLKKKATAISLAKAYCVYQRGLEEFTNLPASVVSADQYAHARVNRFLRLVNGERAFAGYTQDDDLLPVGELAYTREFKEWMHPRGRDGQWIEKLGRVKIFDFPDSTKNPRLGEVVDTLENGIYVRMDDNNKVEIHQKDVIEESDSIARLDRPAHAQLPVSKPNTKEIIYREPIEEDYNLPGINKGAKDLIVAENGGGLVYGKYRDSQNRLKTVYSTDYDEITKREKFLRSQRLFEIISALDATLDKSDIKNDTAVVVRLIRHTGLRPGSEKETRARVKAYGATTLESRHVVQQEDGSVRLVFIGKEGVPQDHLIDDPQLAKALLDRRSKDPNQQLFKTNDTKLNHYIKDALGEEFTTKDLRTLKANAVALAIMSSMSPPNTKAEFIELRREVSIEVSEVLGNNPAMALKAYINPMVFAVWIKDPAWLQ